MSLELKREDRPVKEALQLSADDPEHIRTAASIVKEGGVIALPFHGIYGLAGDVDNINAVGDIFKAKDRPPNQTLITIAAPEYLLEVADAEITPYGLRKVQSLYRSLHALGLILPPSERAPRHLVSTEGTILNIWTEYQPLRDLTEAFRKLGGRAFVGTSANKHGQPTHHSVDTLMRDFSEDIDAVLVTDFSSLPEERRKSTSIVDLTGDAPRLHRLGNVSEQEIVAALAENGFPEMEYTRDVIMVRGTGKLVTSR